MEAGNIQTKVSESEEKKICVPYFLTYKDIPGKSWFAGHYYDDSKQNNPSREVFIRRYDLRDDSQTKPSERDLDVLRRSDARIHENFIRFYVSIKENNFVYAATEYLPYSVEDFFKKDSPADLKGIRMKLGAKEILRQSTEGLAYLHSLGYLHRNLNPSVFRIASYHNTIHQIKISDFRRIKDSNALLEFLNNSAPKDKDGWIAPESVEKGKSLKQSVDVFILGTYYYYVLFGGDHPFGTTSKRISRITKRMDSFYSKSLMEEKYDLEKKYNKVWLDNKQISIEAALQLLQKMIKFEPVERIQSNQIMKEPFFLPDIPYEIYSGDSRIPGLILVFSQENFYCKEFNVPGHKYDSSKLIETFVNLGFKREIHRDLTADQIKNEISKLAKDPVKLLNYNSLVVCLLSHGNYKAVYGTDGQPAHIHQLQYAFNSHDCPAMHDKPKIFIVQACRVPKELHNNPSNQNAKREKFFEKLPQLQDPVTDPVKYGMSKNRSPVNDFLGIMATINGTEAFANRDGGPSNFTTKLCAHLKRCEPDNITTDLEHILSKVQEDMTSDREYFFQTPERISSLRKKIFFRFTPNA